MQSYTGEIGKLKPVSPELMMLGESIVRVIIEACDRWAREHPHKLTYDEAASLIMCAAIQIVNQKCEAPLEQVQEMAIEIIEALQIAHQQHPELLTLNAKNERIH